MDSRSTGSLKSSVSVPVARFRSKFNNSGGIVSRMYSTTKKPGKVSSIATASLSFIS